VEADLPTFPRQSHLEEFSEFHDRIFACPFTIPFWREIAARHDAIDAFSSA
jgi:hypothetical protein